MRRFSWSEMRRYWETHAERWADLDFDEDPEGLTNVCHPGAPLWLNAYYARFQRRVYENLLSLAPEAVPGARALDVGCGAGRWCALLRDRGYTVTGIDLQPQLIERNRQRMPEVEFVRASAQEYETMHRFDVISTVTVLQHVPFDEQDTAIAKLRALCAPGAYVIALENVRDQDPHVFANSPRGWRSRFERAGFRLVTMQRYDYSPFLRLVGVLRRLGLRLLGRGAALDPGVTPEGLVGSAGRKDALTRFSDAAKRVAVRLDSAIEPVLVAQNVPLPTVHRGYLFRAI